MFNIIFDEQHAYFQHKYDEVPDVRHYFRHIHENIEIYVFVKGKAYFNIEGNIFTLSPYDLVIIPPMCYHCLVLEELSDYERYVFNFPLSKYTDEEGVFDKVKVFNISNNNQLLSLIKRLDLYNERLSEPDFKRMCAILMQELLVLLKNDNSISLEHDCNALTKQILAYINENIYENLNVEQIAQHLFLSKSHIQNVFYSNMRIGIKTYIMQKRMSLAKTMLSSGMRPIDVSQKLGYTSYPTFYKNFVKLYRQQPKEIYDGTDEI